MLNFIFNRRDPVTATEVTRFQQAQTKRAQQFKNAWKAYCGELPNPLRVRDGDYNDNVKLSLPRLTVDKGVAALFGEETHFEVEGGVEKEGGEEKRSPDQLYLDKVWKQNKKMSLLHCLGVSGGVYGQAFARIIPGNPGQLPRLIDLCPETMDIVFDPEDIDKHIAYIQTWSGVDQTTGKAVSYRDTIKRNDNARGEAVNWTITKEIQFEGELWKPRKPEELWRYTWSPIHTCQNLQCPDEVWGMSDIEPDILSINNAINFAASNINRILRFHAHPKLVATGIQASDMEMSVDGVTCLPSADSKLIQIEMMSSLADALQYWNLLKDAYDEHTRIPGIARGKVEDVGTLSGVALHILYGPLMEKTAVKRLTYGEMLTELNQHLLEMGGYNPETEIEVKWGHAMPSDEKGEAEVAEIHSRLGVSTYTILEKLGYDAEEEQKKKGAEDDAVMNREAELMQARFDKGAV